MKLDFKYKLSIAIKADTIDKYKELCRWIGAAVWMSCQRNSSAKSEIGLGKSQIWSIDVTTPNGTLHKELITLKPNAYDMDRRLQETWYGGDLEGILGSSNSPDSRNDSRGVISDSNVHRNLKSSVVPFTITVHSYLRYLAEWMRLKTFVTTRLSANIADGYFKSVLKNCTIDQGAGIKRATGAHFHRMLENNTGLHSRSFPLFEDTNRRELVEAGFLDEWKAFIQSGGALSVLPEPASNKNTMFITSDGKKVYCNDQLCYTAYQGNEPSGSPTGQPSTSPTSQPISYTVRLQRMGLIKANTMSASASPIAVFLLMWAAAGIAWVALSANTSYSSRMLKTRADKRRIVDSVAKRSGKQNFKIAPAPSTSVASSSSADSSSSSSADSSSATKLPPLSRITAIETLCGYYCASLFGTPKGIFSREAAVTRLWTEFKRYHSFFAPLYGESTNCPTGSVDTTRHTWNRLMHFAHICTSVSASFTVVAILLIPQYPGDDGSCSQSIRRTKATCLTRNIHFIANPALPYCKWIEESLACVRATSTEIDSTVVIITALLAAVACSVINKLLNSIFHACIIGEESGSHMTPAGIKASAIDLASGVLPKDSVGRRQLLHSLYLRRQRNGTNSKQSVNEVSSVQDSDSNVMHTSNASSQAQGYQAPLACTVRAEKSVSMMSRHRVDTLMHAMHATRSTFHSMAFFNDFRASLNQDTQGEDSNSTAVTGKALASMLDMQYVCVPEDAQESQQKNKWSMRKHTRGVAPDTSESANSFHSLGKLTYTNATQKFLTHSPPVLVIKQAQAHTRAKVSNTKIVRNGLQLPPAARHASYGFAILQAFVGDLLGRATQSLASKLYLQKIEADLGHRYRSKPLARSVLLAAVACIGINMASCALCTSLAYTYGADWVNSWYLTTFLVVLNDVFFLQPIFVLLVACLMPLCAIMQIDIAQNLLLSTMMSTYCQLADESKTSQQKGQGEMNGKTEGTSLEKGSPTHKIGEPPDVNEWGDKPFLSAQPSFVSWYLSKQHHSLFESLVVSRYDSPWLDATAMEMYCSQAEQRDKERFQRRQVPGRAGQVNVFNEKRSFSNYSFISMLAGSDVYTLKMCMSFVITVCLAAARLLVQFILPLSYAGMANVLVFIVLIFLVVVSLVIVTVQLSMNRVSQSSTDVRSARWRSHKPVLLKWADYVEREVSFTVTLPTSMYGLDEDLWQPAEGSPQMSREVVSRKVVIKRIARCKFPADVFEHIESNPLSPELEEKLDDLLSVETPSQAAPRYPFTNSYSPRFSPTAQSNTGSANSKFWSLAHRTDQESCRGTTSPFAHDYIPPASSLTSTPYMPYSTTPQRPDGSRLDDATLRAELIVAKARIMQRSHEEHSKLQRELNATRTRSQNILQRRLETRQRLQPEGGSITGGLENSITGPKIPVPSIADYESGFCFGPTPDSTPAKDVGGPSTYIPSNAELAESAAEVPIEAPDLSSVFPEVDSNGTNENIVDEMNGDIDDDDEDDSNRPAPVMSAGLMRMLGMEVQEELATDWSPPLTTGLDNSTAIVQDEFLMNVENGGVLLE